MVYDQTAVLDGNNIRTLVTNRGTVSGPSEETNDLVWKQDGQGHGFEFGLLVAASVTDSTKIREHIVSDGIRSRRRAGPLGWQPQTCVNGKLVLRPESRQIPTVTRPSSQPKEWFIDSLRGSFWPDDGVPDAPVADVEARFYMNDYGNSGYSYRPFGTDDPRRGLGLEVASRVLQWTADTLADALRLQFDIWNRSNKSLDSLVVGIWGDPHIRGRDDFEDDLARFDSAAGVLVTDPDSSTFLSFQASDSRQGRLRPIAVAYDEAIQLSDDALWSNLTAAEMALPKTYVGDEVFLLRSKPLLLKAGARVRVCVSLQLADGPEIDVTDIDCSLRVDSTDQKSYDEPDQKPDNGDEPNEPDTKRPEKAEFTARVSRLTVEFEDLTNDPDSLVRGRIWDFGDLESATGQTAVHTYSSAGTYGVSLTLQVDSSHTITVTRPVTLSAPIRPNDHCSCPKILAVGMDSIFVEADLTTLVKKFGLWSLLRRLGREPSDEAYDLQSMLGALGVKTVMKSFVGSDATDRIMQDPAFAGLDTNAGAAAALLDSLTFIQGLTIVIDSVGMGSILDELERTHLVAKAKFDSLRTALNIAHGDLSTTAQGRLNWLFTELDKERVSRDDIIEALGTSSIWVLLGLGPESSLTQSLGRPSSIDSLRFSLIDAGLQSLVDRVGLDSLVEDNSLQAMVEWIGLSAELDNLGINRKNVQTRLGNSLAALEPDSLFRRLGLDRVKELINVDSMLAAVGLQVVPATYNRLREAARGVTSGRDIVKARDFLRDAASSSVATLRKAAGIEVMDIGPNQQHVSIGGLGMPLEGKPLVLVDHRRGAIPGLGANVFAVLPIAAIDLAQAEIAQGNGFVDYGPDSDDGFIQFQTKDPFRYPGTDVSVGGGQLSMAQAAVRYADTTSSSFGYKIVGSYTTATDSSLLDYVNNDKQIAERLDSFFEGRGEKTWSTYVRGSTVYRPCDCLTLTANGDLAAAKINLVDTDGGLFLDDFRVASGQLMLESPVMFAQAYYTHVDPGNSVTESAVPFSDNAQTVAAQFRYRVGTIPYVRTFLPKEFMLGFDYASTSLPDGPVLNDSPDQDQFVGKSAKTSITSTDRSNLTERAIVTDMVVPLPFAKLRAGNRIEFDDLGDQTRWLSPRVSLAGQPSEQHHISISYNRSFSLNSNAAFFRNAYFSAETTFDAATNVRTDLPDTYTRMWNLMYRYTGIRNGFLELNTFHARKTELIPPPIFAVGDVVVGSGEDSGLQQPTPDQLRPDVHIDYWGADLRFDLRGGYRISDETEGATPRWRAFASASWLSDNFFTGDELDAALESFVTTMNAPRFRFRLGYERELESGTWFSILTRYSGEHDVWYGSRIGQLPRTLSIDASVSQPLGDRTRLTLTGRNLEGDRHREFPQAPATGRYFAAKVTHHLN